MGVSPDITTPIVRDGQGQTLSNVNTNLGLLAQFVAPSNANGNWNSPMTPDGAQSGYNVMPLPQLNTPASGNVILRDFHYYEEMTFSAIPGDAANRGGNYQMNCWVLFYEQRVYFGYDAGGAANTLVHAENGDWLHLVNAIQDKGANENPSDPVGGAPDPLPVPSLPYVKQVSVPHGNSILATGTGSGSIETPNTTVLEIPDANTIPTGSGVTTELLTLYNGGVNDPSNLTINPNKVLQDYITNHNTGDKAIKSWTSLTVSSKNSGGAVTNIDFETKHAKVTDFTTTFWIATLVDGTQQIQYSQNIEMQFYNDPSITYYHIDANTLVPVS